MHERRLLLEGGMDGGIWNKFKSFLLDNYDIVFPNTTENNFLVLGTVNKDFDEFTFSAWIKFNPGFMIYPLMSYTSKSSAETIALAFYADDASRGSIKSFSGNLFGHHKG